MNDRTVTFYQNVKKPEAQSGDMILNYTGKDSLIEAYRLFCLKATHKNLIVVSNEKFIEATESFNKMFIRIGAAGGIVRNQKREFLFIKRLGMWDLPKGKLHKNESVTMGALREVTEETGLTAIKITKQLASTFHIYTDRKGKEVLKETYWFEMMCTADQQPVPQLEEDITEVRWFSKAELNVPIANTYASLQLLLKKYCFM